MGIYRPYIPSDIRLRVNLRSAFNCERCGRGGEELHHRKRGNPRLHWIQNLVRLCRPCHEWATIQPGEAEKTGWVLTGIATPLRAAQVPLALLGRIWVRLSPDGRYSVGPALLNDMREVPSARATLRRTGWGSSQPLRTPITPSSADDVGLGEPSERYGLLDEPREVHIPTEFFVQPGESVSDLLARLNQEGEAIDRLR